VLDSRSRPVNPPSASLHATSLITPTRFPRLAASWNQPTWSTKQLAPSNRGTAALSTSAGNRYPCSVSPARISVTAYPPRAERSVSSASLTRSAIASTIVPYPLPQPSTLDDPEPTTDYMLSIEQLFYFVKYPKP